MGHYIGNTSDLYKYMESDGYPVSISPAMLSDLRVELREYQKQVNLPTLLFKFILYLFYIIYFIFILYLFHIYF
jgi:hypothetical protein